ncbi:MAG: hypothetical protein Q9227_004311 [Pyrenula ochraceoflavens]
MPLPGPRSAHPGHSSLMKTPVNSSNLFPDQPSTTNQSLSSAISDLNSEFDDFLASPLSFSLPDTSEADISSHVNFFSDSLDQGSSNSSTTLLNSHSSLYGGNSSNLAAFPDQAFPEEIQNFPIASKDQLFKDNSRPPVVDESHYSCLVMALSLMKQLFPNRSSSCIASTDDTHSPDRPTSIPTIQAVIAKNEKIIEAVSQMLHCSCAQDTYLLTVTSLIVFKLLGWYAAAVRSRWEATSSIDGDNDTGTYKFAQLNDDSDSRNVTCTDSLQTHSSSISSSYRPFERVRQAPAVVGSYRLDGEDSGRMTAQLVLSELHRVQRLVNQLSTKLKAQVHAAKIRDSEKESLLDNVTNNNTGIFPSLVDDETTSPFSAVMLERMADDLKKRLRMLSLEIVERLRME